MKYKGKTLMPPPRNTKYIPVKAYTGLQDKDMAITDIEVVGDSQYCKIGEDVFFWDYIAQNIKDASTGSMCGLYPETFKTMTSIPDQLDLGERTNLDWFFSSTPDDFHYTEDGFDAYIQNGDGGCRALLTAPMMDTSKIITMKNMFGYHYKMSISKKEGKRIIPKTFEYTNACVSMTSIPQYNTSNVTNFQGMFSHCENLRDVPELNTSKAENVSYMYQGCTSLPKVFPWTINFDNLVFDNLAAEPDKNDVNKFKGMFEGSSVEEITIMMNGLNKDANYVFNSETFDTDEVLTVTPENLDSTGTLKKINVFCPGYDPEEDPNAQYNAKHYLVRIRQND